MIEHLNNSRILKAFTDSNGTPFSEAEQRLACVSVAIVAGEASRASVAGQAALLTAVAVSAKVFKQVVLVSPKDIALQRPIPGGTTLGSAAIALGARLSVEIPENTTHMIVTEQGQAGKIFAVRCWWDRWRSGVLPCWDARQLGEDWNPLAGVFSAALAVREIFAHVIGTRIHGPRTTTISLWEPWETAEDAKCGPDKIFIPKRMWIVGLGHLGQGFLWNLSMLPAHGEILVLQDYQYAEVENEATGLLTTHASIGKRKTRIAAQWIEQFGWKTELIERKFTSHMMVSDYDPPLVITALDKPQPRIDVLKAGFDYMIDVGVGHGPLDFESSQIRVLAKGNSPSWNHSSLQFDPLSLMNKEPYSTIAKSDRCGAFQLAEASVAVPFVGAAVGSLAIAQALRLTAMEGAPSLIQVELSAPDFSSANDLRSAPEVNIGGVPLDLKTGEFIL